MSRTSVTISLDAQLVQEVKFLLLDPKFGRVGYGKLSGLIEGFLKDWLEEQKKGTPNESRGSDDAGE